MNIPNCKILVVSGYLVIPGLNCNGILIRGHASVHVQLAKLILLRNIIEKLVVKKSFSRMHYLTTTES